MSSRTLELLVKGKRWVVGASKLVTQCVEEILLGYLTVRVLLELHDLLMPQHMVSNTKDIEVLLLKESQLIFTNFRHAKNLLFSLVFEQQHLLF